MTSKLNLPMHPQRLKQEAGKDFIFCQVRKKFFVLTPEEWVRQQLISYLNKDLKHPLSLMKIEKQVKGGQRNKRADIVICHPTGEANMLVECKAPTEKLGKETFFQLGRYNQQLNASFLLISNGMEHFCCRVTESHEFDFLQGIPAYTSTIE